MVFRSYRSVPFTVPFVSSQSRSGPFTVPISPVLDRFAPFFQKSHSFSGTGRVPNGKEQYNTGPHRSDTGLFVQYRYWTGSKKRTAVMHRYWTSIGPVLDRYCTGQIPVLFTGIGAGIFRALPFRSDTGPFPFRLFRVCTVLFPVPLRSVPLHRTEIRIPPQLSSYSVACLNKWLTNTGPRSAA